MLELERKHGGIVCGIDEAGRGPLAGPVTAACVYIPADRLSLPFWSKVNDSKKLTAARRHELFDLVRQNSCHAIAQASAEEIDSINILQATLLAMKRAYDDMCAAYAVTPHHALIDGNFAPKISCNTVTVVKGDSLSLSIAAASILAKVSRDRVMADLHEQHPAYNWKSNAGYGTEEHREALALHGVTIHHRKSFAPVRERISAASG